MAIVGQVADLRLMSARQIEAIHFSASEHESVQAAARARQRVLGRLVRDRLLIRLERRIGGVRAGSVGFVFAVGPVGYRLLVAGGHVRRFQEPTSRFLDHTLATAQLIVDVTIASRRGLLDILVCQAEPRCHREFSGLSGRRLLRPDAFLALGVGAFEWRWFCEIDRGSESVPVILRKCRLYADYYQSGQEQAKHGGAFPTVCWIVPDTRRAERLRQAIEHDRHLPDRLFKVTTSGQALTVLMGGQP
jgi:hypothetical protein